MFIRSCILAVLVIFATLQPLKAQNGITSSTSIIIFNHANSERVELVISDPSGPPAEQEDRSEQLTTQLSLRFFKADGIEMGSPLVAPPSANLPTNGFVRWLISAGSCDAAGANCKIFVDSGNGPQDLPGNVNPVGGRIALRINLGCDGHCNRKFPSQLTVVGSDGATRAISSGGLGNEMWCTLVDRG